MEKLFACYFENEGDINDLATLAEIAVAVQLFSTEEAAHKFMKSDELEEEVAKLQKAIVDASGPTLKRQQKACDRSKEKLNNANKDLNVNKVSLKISSKAMEKANSARQRTEKELLKLTNKSDLMETKFAELEANIQEVKEA